MTTPSFLKRSPANPVLSARDVPYAASLVFNAGVVKYQGRYVMLFRNDYGSTEEEWRAHFRDPDNAPAPKLETNIGLAESADGVRWEVHKKPVFTMRSEEFIRAYDPRLTVIDGRVHLCFAVDTRHGLRGGVAVTDDFEKFDVLSLSAPDNRNMVLFPERIGGKLVRLERPFPVYSRGGGEFFDVWCSASPDGRYWGDTALVLGGESVPFANAKIGPAAPPVRTRLGWLTTFHAVEIVERELSAWHPDWHKRYVAGLMLLDLDDPRKVVAMAPAPLIDPETGYEKTGFRGEVIFPGGMVLEDDGEVKIYYGAADTVECLATAALDDLLDFCMQGKK